ncbi:hypothetical protein [uncultured Sphingomonas sp.]|uniref:hypothetical protein n=1 Tax=uncultured Sphingomonas sp. TaxID=158754 RepID=UPI0025EFB872|nr:hypothetical protein [uncultured Sphingomonas sp.]
MRFVTSLLIFGLVAAPVSAQQPPSHDNADIQKLFVADQAAREGISTTGPIDRARVVALIAADGQRRGEARRLLDAGALHSANDFYAAAFIFQHGTTPEDYLLAHSLALAAAAGGKKEAAWIAAATLDRYLQKIGQKQIYGTQYLVAKDTGPTMEPYDAALVPDSLRTALGVPDKAAQAKRLDGMKAAMPGHAKP